MTTRAALAAGASPPESALWAGLAVWLDSLASPQTRRSYQTAARGFIAFHGFSSVEALRAAGPTQIMAWRDHLLGTGASPHTVQNRLAAVASLFRHLGARWNLADNPAVGIQRPRLEQPQAAHPLRLALEQVRHLLYAPALDTLMGVRDRAILHVLFYTGCRISAIAQLQVRDWRLEADEWLLALPDRDGARRALVAHPELCRALRAYLAQTGHGSEPEAPLFLALRDSVARRPLTTRQVSKLFQRYVQAAHLPPEVTPHSARATFISSVLERRCPIEAVRAAVGHRRRATTERYNPRRPYYRYRSSFSGGYEPVLSGPDSDPAPGN